MLGIGFITTAQLCQMAGIKVSALPYLQRTFGKEQIKPFGKLGQSLIWKEDDIQRVRSFRALLKFNPGRPKRIAVSGRKG